VTGPTLPTQPPDHRLHDHDDRSAVVASDQHTLVQLLRRNAVVFQVGVALLWSLRFMAAAGMPQLPLVVAVGGALVVRAAFRSTVA